MALLAMHMLAVALADLAPGCALADGPEQFDAAWRAGYTPIWLPESMVLASGGIPAAWGVDSDSLAAWLACRGAVRGVVRRCGELVLARYQSGHGGAVALFVHGRCRLRRNPALPYRRARRRGRA